MLDPASAVVVVLMGLMTSPRHVLIRCACLLGVDVLGKFRTNYHHRIDHKQPIMACRSTASGSIDALLLMAVA